MSICKILAQNKEYPDRRYEVGTVQKHYDMPNWLKENGQKQLVYELHKGTIHSRWIWKTDRWGRTETPSTKVSITTDENDVKEPRDRQTRKENRKKKLERK